MTTTPEETTLLSAMHGSVRVLTLHRPASLNSFTAQMNVELRVALEDAAADASVRALIITGAGRGFCAGQDLNDPALGAGENLDVGGVVEQRHVLEGLARGLERARSR